MINRIEIAEYRVPLRTPLVTAVGTIRNRQGLIIRAETDAGLIGLGEIAPLEGFSVEALNDVRATTITMVQRLRGKLVPESPSQAHDICGELLKDPAMPPSVCFGLETLLGDLASQRAGMSLSRWLNPRAVAEVPVNAVVSGSLSEIRKQIELKLPRGYPAYKLKAGTTDREDDLARIALLRDSVGDGIRIRLDANRSFDFAQAASLLESVHKYNIEYIEEPLQTGLHKRLAPLRAQTGMRIALDETLLDSRVGEQSFNILDRAFWFAGQQAFDVAIIKPTIAGGIVSMIRLISELKGHGIESVISSAIESGVGLAANLHLAAALGQNVLPCGLDTLDLLSDPLILESLPIERGCIRVLDRPGLGVTIPNFRDNPRLKVIA